jgi:hypothetical protein
MNDVNAYLIHVVAKCHYKMMTFVNIIEITHNQVQLQD